MLKNTGLIFFNSLTYMKNIEIKLVDNGENLNSSNNHLESYENLSQDVEGLLLHADRINSNGKSRDGLRYLGEVVPVEEYVGFFNELIKQTAENDKDYRSIKQIKDFNERELGFVADLQYYSGALLKPEVLQGLSHVQQMGGLNYNEKFVETPQKFEGYKGYEIAKKMFENGGRVDEENYNPDSSFFSILGSYRHPDTGEMIDVAVVGQNSTATTKAGMYTPEDHKKLIDFLDRVNVEKRVLHSYVDTPGADAGKEANQNYQSEMIAAALQRVTNMKVPHICYMVGQGGSGGAIVIKGGANRTFIVKDGFYYTIHPIGLGFIARSLKLSNQEVPQLIDCSPFELVRDGHVDGIIKTDITDKSKDLDTSDMLRLFFDAYKNVDEEVKEVMHTEDAMEDYLDYLSDVYHVGVNMDQFKKFGGDKKVFVESVLDQAHKNFLELHPESIDMSYEDFVKKELWQFDERVRHKLNMEKSKQMQRYKTAEQVLREPITDRKVDRVEVKDSVDEGEASRKFVESLREQDCDYLLRKMDEMQNTWRSFNSLRKRTLKEAKKKLGKMYSVTEESNIDEQDVLIDYILYSLISGEGYAYAHDVLMPVLNKKEGLDDVFVLLANSDHDSAAFLLSCAPEKTLKIAAFYRVLDGFATELCKNPLNLIDQLNQEKEGGDIYISGEYLLEKFDAAMEGVDINEEDFFNWFSDKDCSEWHKKAIKFIMQYNNKVDPRRKQVAPIIEAVLEYIRSKTTQKKSWFKSVKRNNARVLLSQLNLKEVDFPNLWAMIQLTQKDRNTQWLLEDVKLEEQARLKKIPKTHPKLSIDYWLDYLPGDFHETNGDMMPYNCLNFPKFGTRIRQNIEDETKKYKGALTTGVMKMEYDGSDFEYGLALSNPGFQAGAIDQSSGIKMDELLDECMERKIPAVFVISCGGMNTKDGVGALESMARLTRKIDEYKRRTGLPVVMVAFGDSKGGFEASILNHPDVITYYLSGTDKLFAGRGTVPEFIPVNVSLVDLVEEPKFGLLKDPRMEDYDEFYGKLVDIWGPEKVNKANFDLNEELNKIFHEVTKGDFRKTLALDHYMEVHTKEEGSNGIDFCPKLNELEGDELEAALERLRFDSVLIANRGVIKGKLVTACRNIGITPILMHVPADKDSLTYSVAPNKIKTVSSYGNSEDVIACAKLNGVEAIAYGYGFFAEDPVHHEKALKAGLINIAPPLEAVQTCSQKVKTLQAMMDAGVPVQEGSKGIVPDLDAAYEVCERIGYPVILKADTGGGGRGIKIVRKKEDLKAKWTEVKTQAASVFPTDDVFIEKFVTNARHIEFQVLRDHWGNVVVFDERDCTLQRKGQKMLEESPSSIVTPEMRAEIKKAVKTAAENLNLIGPNTVEFLLDMDTNAFSFMEVNPRIQVENEVTGIRYSSEKKEIDLVEWQLKIARGEKIGFTQEEMDRQVENEPRHTIELRLCAEDIAKDFAIDPGKVTDISLPKIDGVVIDLAIKKGKTLSGSYDSMFGTLIASAENREECFAKLREALEKIKVDGVFTNMPVLKVVLDDERVCEGSDYNIKYFEDIMNPEIEVEGQEKIDSLEEKEKERNELVKTVNNLVASLENGDIAGDEVESNIADEFKRLKILEDEISDLKLDLAAIPKKDPGIEEVIKFNTEDRKRKLEARYAKYKKIPTGCPPLKASYWYGMAGQKRKVNVGSIISPDDPVCVIMEGKGTPRELTIKDLHMPGKQNEGMDPSQRFKVTKVSFEDGVDIMMNADDDIITLFEFEEVTN